MKIVSYEIPYTLIKKGSNVEMTLDESNKKMVGEESVGDQQATNVPNIAKELGDYNDKQRTLTKSIMLGSQTEAKGTITLKYLV